MRFIGKSLSFIALLGIGGLLIACQQTEQANRTKDEANVLRAQGLTYLAKGDADIEGLSEKFKGKSLPELNVIFAETTNNYAAAKQAFLDAAAKYKTAANYRINAKFKEYLEFYVKQSSKLAEAMEILRQRAQLIATAKDMSFVKKYTELGEEQQVPLKAVNDINTQIKNFEKENKGKIIE